MEGNIKKIFEIKNNEVEKPLDNVDISQDDWDVLNIIAQRVGNDFNMKIKLGKPGESNYFNPEDCSITFDPLVIKEDPDLAKFVAAHEGSHRAITPKLNDMGISPEKEKELYSQIGFGYLQNVIEDPAVNNWMIERFPGLKVYNNKVYNEQFKEDNVVLSTPEVQLIATELGYWPKFVQYGSEVIRDWYQKRFSNNLDLAVEKALKRTIDYARQSIAMTPNAQTENLNKQEVIIKGQTRFRINTEDIWPEVKKLVEMDLHTEKIRQMLKEINQKEKQLEQKKKELEQAQQEGDQKKADSLQQEIQDLEKILEKSMPLSEEAKTELHEQIEKATKEAIDKLQQEIQEKQKQWQAGEQQRHEMEERNKALQKQIQGASDKDKEEIEKQIEQNQREQLATELKQKKIAQELEQLQDTLNNIQSGKEIPYPEKELSSQIKSELDKLFQKLPYKKQQELHNKAKEQLEKLEDSINQEIEGKLNEDKPDSHKELNTQEAQKREQEEMLRREEIDKKKLERKLDAIRREKMTDYDKAYEEVIDVIDSLYNRLQRFLLPKRHPKWQKGYSTGSRVELDKAMQAEADPRYLEQLWERKTIPHKFDYRFSILVDLSGSMKGEKREETFKGLVVLAEVLERLNIPYTVRGFSDSSRMFKDWKEKLTPETRNKLAEMKYWGDGSTETTQSTAEAIDDLKNNLGKDNFLITLTDGQPNDARSLYNLLSQAQVLQEKKIKLVGIGLGPDTEFVQEYYPASLVLPNVKPEIQNGSQSNKNFADAFADLLEDIIKHPENY